MALRINNKEWSQISKVNGKLKTSIAKILGKTVPASSVEYYISFGSATQEPFPYGQNYDNAGTQVYTSTAITSNGQTGTFFTNSNLTTPLNMGSTKYFDVYQDSGKGIQYISFTVILSGNNFTAHQTTPGVYWFGNNSMYAGADLGDQNIACSMLSLTTYYTYPQPPGLGSTFYLNRVASAPAANLYISDGNFVYITDVSGFCYSSDPCGGPPI